MARETGTPGIENPNVPPNFSTYVRLETRSRAGPAGWIRTPAADGSPIPKYVGRTSVASRVCPAASVTVAGSGGVPWTTRGRSVIVNVAGEPETFVTYRSVRKKSEFAPVACEAWAITMSSDERGTRCAAANTPSPVVSSTKVA